MCYYCAFVYLCNFTVFLSRLAEQVLVKCLVSSQYIVSAQPISATVFIFLWLMLAVMNNAARSALCTSFYMDIDFPLP